MAYQAPQTFWNNFRKVLEETLHNIAVITDLSGKSLPANTPLLETDYIADFTGWIRLQILLVSAATITVIINKNEGYLNGGVSLAENNLYEFDITITKGDQFNIKIDVAQTPKIFRIIKMVV